MGIDNGNPYGKSNKFISKIISMQVKWPNWEAGILLAESQYKSKQHKSTSENGNLNENLYVK